MESLSKWWKKLNLGMLFWRERGKFALHIFFSVTLPWLVEGAKHFKSLEVSIVLGCNMFLGQKSM
jgi:hypothetical protein